MGDQWQDEVFVKAPKLMNTLSIAITATGKKTSDFPHFNSIETILSNLEEGGFFVCPRTGLLVCLKCQIGIYVSLNYSEKSAAQSSEMQDSVKSHLTHTLAVEARDVQDALVSIMKEKVGVILQALTVINPDAPRNWEERIRSKEPCAPLGWPKTQMFFMCPECCWGAKGKALQKAHILKRHGETHLSSAKEAVPAQLIMRSDAGGKFIVSVAEVSTSSSSQCSKMDYVSRTWDEKSIELQGKYKMLQPLPLLQQNSSLWNFHACESKSLNSNAEPFSPAETPNEAMSSRQMSNYTFKGTNPDVQVGKRKLKIATISAPVSQSNQQDSTGNTEIQSDEASSFAENNPDFSFTSESSLPKDGNEHCILRPTNREAPVEESLAIGSGASSKGCSLLENQNENGATTSQPLKGCATVESASESEVLVERMQALSVSTASSDQRKEGVGNPTDKDIKDTCKEKDVTEVEQKNEKTEKADSAKRPALAPLGGSAKCISSQIEDMQKEETVTDVALEDEEKEVPKKKDEGDCKRKKLTSGASEACSAEPSTSCKFVFSDDTYHDPKLRLESGGNSEKEVDNIQSECAADSKTMAIEGSDRVSGDHKKDHSAEEKEKGADSAVLAPEIGDKKVTAKKEEDAGEKGRSVNVALEVSSAASVADPAKRSNETDKAAKKEVKDNIVNKAESKSTQNLVGTELNAGKGSAIGLGEVEKGHSAGEKERSAESPGSDTEVGDENVAGKQDDDGGEQQSAAIVEVEANSDSLSADAKKSSRGETDQDQTVGPESEQNPEKDVQSIAEEDSAPGLGEEEKGHNAGEKEKSAESPGSDTEVGDENVAAKKDDDGSEQQSTANAVVEAHFDSSSADVKHSPISEADQDQFVGPKSEQNPEKDVKSIAEEDSAPGLGEEEKGHSAGEKEKGAESPGSDTEVGDENVAGKKDDDGGERQSAAIVEVEANSDSLSADAKQSSSGETDQDQTVGPESEQNPEKYVKSIQSECAADSKTIAEKDSAPGLGEEETGHSAGEKEKGADSPVSDTEVGDENVAGEKDDDGSEHQSAANVVVEANSDSSSADVKHSSSGEADQDQTVGPESEQILEKQDASTQPECPADSEISAVKSSGRSSGKDEKNHSAIEKENVEESPVSTLEVGGEEVTDRKAEGAGEQKSSVTVALESGSDLPSVEVKNISIGEIDHDQNSGPKSERISKKDDDSTQPECQADSAIVALECSDRGSGIDEQNHNAVEKQNAADSPASAPKVGDETVAGIKDEPANEQESSTNVDLVVGSATPGADTENIPSATDQGAEKKIEDKRLKVADSKSTQILVDSEVIAEKSSDHDFGGDKKDHSAEEKEKGADSHVPATEPCDENVTDKEEKKVSEKENSADEAVETGFVASGADLKNISNEANLGCGTGSNKKLLKEIDCSCTESLVGSDAVSETRSCSGLGVDEKSLSAGKKLKTADNNVSALNNGNEEVAGKKDEDDGDQESSAYETAESCSEIPGVEVKIVASDTNKNQKIETFLSTESEKISRGDDDGSRAKVSTTSQASAATHADHASDGKVEDGKNGHSAVEGEKKTGSPTSALMTGAEKVADDKEVGARVKESLTIVSAENCSVLPASDSKNLPSDTD